MKKLASLFLLIILACSCKEKTNYQLQIFLKNDTDSEITVTLYPKDEYKVGDLYYDFCSFGGGSRNTVFNIDTKMEQELYISDVLDNEPYLLAKQVFDSIHITFAGKTEPGIKFSPEKVTGYPDNLYSQNSDWTYEKRQYAFITMFQTNLTESEDYIFIITANEKK